MRTTAPLLRRREDLSPPCRALLNIGIVPLRVIAIVPILLRGRWLDIDAGCRFGIDRWWRDDHWWIGIRRPERYHHARDNHDRMPPVTMMSMETMTSMPRIGRHGAAYEQGRQDDHDSYSRVHVSSPRTNPPSPAPFARGVGHIYSIALPGRIGETYRCPPSSSKLQTYQRRGTRRETSLENRSTSRGVLSSAVSTSPPGHHR